MAPTRRRLDSELVRRGLARSREQAAELVTAGRVRVAGAAAVKPATVVDAATPLQVRADDGPGYASRGGHKLAGALDDLGGPAVEGRSCLDAGASAGGFTDVLLRRGARHVVAVDVGYGQLDWRLRTDGRVSVLDRFNVRNLTAGALPVEVDLVVGDLSFISLGVVLPALRSSARDAADFLLLVKPQFEVGRERLPAGGVVRDPQDRAAAVRGVAGAAHRLGLGVRGVVASRLPGPAGNRELFLWLAAGAPPLDEVRLAEAVGVAPAVGAP